MTVPNIPGVPALPPAPQRTTPQAEFRPKADAFMAALPPFGVALNATVAAINAAITYVAESLATIGGYLVTALAVRDATLAAANLALNAPGTMATSLSPVTIGAGEKVFEIQPGKSLGSGPTVSAGVRGDGTKRMLGPIVSYDKVTGELRMRSDSFEGAGEFADWEIMLAAGDAMPAATKEDIWAGTTAGKVITPKIEAEADAFQDIAYSATLAWNVATQGRHVRVVLAGNPNMQVPSGMKLGRYYVMLLGSGAGGARSWTFPSLFDFGGINPTPSTAANKWDALRLQCTDEAAGACKATFVKAG